MVLVLILKYFGICLGNFTDLKNFKFQVVCNHYLLKQHFDYYCVTFSLSHTLSELEFCERVSVFAKFLKDIFSYF